MRPFNEKTSPSAGGEDPETLLQEATSSTGPTAREMRDQLYREAIDNPGSEAHAILRSGSDPFEEAHWTAMGEERARSGAASGPRSRPTAGRKQAQRVVPEVSQLRANLAEVSAAAEAARASLEAGKTMHHMAIYSKIAEVIGLREPPRPHQQESGRGDLCAADGPEGAGQNEQR